MPGPSTARESPAAAPTTYPAPARHVAMVAIGCIALLTAAFVARVGAYPRTDGVAYLDLSDAALAGRWQEFVNAYWSPLFPAMLAAGRATVGAAPTREAPVIALVNAVAALIAALGFADILRSLSRRGALPIEPGAATGAHVACWCAFAAVVLRIAPVTLATPDLWTVAPQLVALAALLRVADAARPGSLAFAAGAALGVGFLAKGAILVLAASYVVALPLLVPRGRVMRSAGLMALGVTLVATPWIVLLSAHEGHVTAGSVATLNLAWYVGGQSSQTPDPDAIGTAALPNQWGHPDGVREVYDFAPHQAGTYPPWTDPTWWHEGIVPQPKLSLLAGVIRHGMGLLWSVFGVSLLVWMVLFAAYRARAAPGDRRLAAALAFLAATQVGVYLPVHLEVRFLGMAWLYACLAVVPLLAEPANIVRRPLRPDAAAAAAATAAAVAVYLFAAPAFGSPIELAIALGVSVSVVFGRSERGRGSWQLVALTAAACVPWSANTLKGIRDGAGTIHRRDVAIVRALHDAGIADGAPVASVNAASPPSWARLGRWRIVREVATSRAAAFWRLGVSERAPILAALAEGDVAAVVGVLDPGAPQPAEWIPVPGTNAVILPAARIGR